LQSLPADVRNGVYVDITLARNRPTSRLRGLVGGKAIRRGSCPAALTWLAFARQVSSDGPNWFDCCDSSRKDFRMQRRTIHGLGLLALLAAILSTSGAAEPTIKVVAAEFPPLTTSSRACRPEHIRSSLQPPRCLIPWSAFGSANACSSPVRKPALLKLPKERKIFSLFQLIDSGVSPPEAPKRSNRGVYSKLNDAQA